MRILLVEDDVIARKQQAKLMKSYGICEQADDGKQAVEAFEAGINSGNPYDLISLDLMMPVMDGFQALLTIRDLEREYNILPADGVKIILITSLGDENNIQEAFDEGCTAYVGRPVTAEKIAATLTKLGLL